MASKLSDQDMAELAALADGTLPPERREPLEARIAESPELQELLDRQRRALTATRDLASQPVPAALQTDVQRRVRGKDARRPRRRLVPGLAVGGTLAAATAVVLVLVLAGGPSGPTVADAARLATSPPTGPAPAPVGRTKLAAQMEGVVFPNLTHPWGWHQVGVRDGEVDGRDAKVVYYARHGHRVGYAIVGGSALSPPEGAHAVEKRGVSYDTLQVDGRPTVTWQRLGRTCVLTGRASPAELVRLASWRGNGTLTY